MILLWALSTIIVVFVCSEPINPALNKLISVGKRKFLLLALLVYPLIVSLPNLLLVSETMLSDFTTFIAPADDSSSSSSSSSVNQSKKGSYSSCTSTCESNRDTCEAQGTSYEICKGGEGYCLTDCCVMYQSSDEYAAAMCR